ncbi:MAG: leucyl aminopeptidase [Helicobacteraceae bacterium]|nr:leucyl aminopeptidase [Helicobacteraceae bacterium]
MRLEATNKSVGDIKADIRIVFVCDKNLKHRWIEERKLLEKLGFDGADESVCLLAQSGVLFVGVENTDDSESFRIGAAKAIGALKGLKFKTAAIGCYDKKSLVNSAAIIEGLLLGAYEFNAYKSKPKPFELERVIISRENYFDAKISESDLTAAIERAQIVCEAVNLARTLVNTIPEALTPVALADEAAKVAKNYGVDCSIYDEQFLAENNMGAFLAVSRASVKPPRLIHLSYKPKKAKKTVAIVGKGLTYDSGGLSLKPSDYMTTMKADMAGGAAAIAIIAAAARLKLPVAVHSIIGATENMIGGAAYKPDDVLTAKNGKTIEVRNTDAEGRLVLADCLCYAQDTIKEIDYLIDMATLTGACVVALGEYASGVMGHNDKLKTALLQAAEESGELAAVLPFNRHLKKLIKSEIADISNVSSTRYGGAITAALFLSEFVEEKNRDKWAHLDIAGPAYVEKAWGANPYGASGAGTRWIVRYLERIGA